VPQPVQVASQSQARRRLAGCREAAQRGGKVGTLTLEKVQPVAFRFSCGCRGLCGKAGKIGPVLTADRLGFSGFHQAPSGIAGDCPRHSVTCEAAVFFSNDKAAPHQSQQGRQQVSAGLRRDRFRRFQVPAAFENAKSAERRLFRLA